MATNGRLAGEAAAAGAYRPTSRFALHSASLPARSRCVAVAACIALLVLALLIGSRKTSVFAVHQIDVRGAAGTDAASVRRTLAPFLGMSLASVDRVDVVARLRRLPVVTAASVDRSFPHTLRVFVRTERPLAVVRRGPDAWLVSAHGRILRPLARRRAASRLPRIWLPRAVPVGSAGMVTGPARAGVTALAPLAGSPFLGRIRSVAASGGQVVLDLRSGLELRIGAPVAVGLKLAIARRIAPGLADPASTYLDLTVPDHPVAGERKVTLES